MRDCWLPGALEQSGQMDRCQQKWQSDIITAAQPWLEHAIDSWDNITVKHKDEHLDQALLYKDASMEVLLHCFDKHGADSYIHNHKASFLSLCLSGQYVERKWSLDHSSAGSYIECRRGYDGKLGQHAHHPGQLKLQETVVFSSGQSKPVLHTDIHSIQSTGQDPPVTLVLRLKDGAAQSRYTSCFLANNDNAMVAKYVCWTDRKEDRPCTESEKSFMLMVLKKIASQLQPIDSERRRDGISFYNQALVRRTSQIMREALAEN